MMEHTDFFPLDAWVFFSAQLLFQGPGKVESRPSREGNHAETGQEESEFGAS